MGEYVQLLSTEAPLSVSNDPFRHLLIVFSWLWNFRSLSCIFYANIYSPKLKTSFIELGRKIYLLFIFVIFLSVTLQEKKYVLEYYWGVWEKISRIFVRFGFIILFVCCVIVQLEICISNSRYHAAVDDPRDFCVFLFTLMMMGSCLRNMKLKFISISFAHWEQIFFLSFLASLHPQTSSFLQPTLHFIFRFSWFFLAYFSWMEDE